MGERITRLAIISLLPAAVMLWSSGDDRPGGPARALAADPSPSRTPARVAGEVLVRFAPSADQTARGRARSEARARLVRRLPLRGLELLEAEPGSSVDAAVARLERRSDVVYAEPNYLRHTSGSVDDRYFPSLWGLHNVGQTVRGTVGTPDADIDAPEAWDVTTGDPANPVAVVDTGIALDHPDFAGQVAAGGHDFVDGDADPTDGNGHGTHVAGTIAARGRDGEGVAGVAFGGRLMPLRALDNEGSGSVADIVTAYRWAAERGVRVINASLGAPKSSRAELDAIRASSQTLFVVAAGNGGDDGIGDDVDATPEYPCAYPEPNVICVAASDSRDELAAFSNRGAVAVDLAAPGVDTLSAALSGYAWSNGTSMAAPHVAGAAALVLARFPTATATDIRTALLESVDRLPGLAGKVASGGRLNAQEALTTLLPTPEPAPNATPASEPIPSSALGPAPVPLPAPEPSGETAAPAPTPPAGTSGSPVAPDTTPPILSLAIRSARRLPVLLRGGLLLSTSCSEACTVAARLRLSRAPLVTIARSTASLGTAGSRRIRIRLSDGARARLRQEPGRRVRLVVALHARDGAGNLRRVHRAVWFARR